MPSSPFSTRRRPARALALIPITIALGGCGQVVDVPPPERMVRIEGALIAGDSISRIRLDWLDDPSSPPVPPDPDAVRVELIGPDRRASLRPAADSAGLFRVSLPIDAGRTYRLRGTVGDQIIEATTTLPDDFVITPIDDTVGVIPVSPERGELVFEWKHAGASIVLADSARFPPGQPTSRLTRGVLFLSPRSPGTIGPTIRLWAMNADLDRYLFAATAPVSNVRGGFGVLGGAIYRTRVVRWR